MAFKFLAASAALWSVRATAGTTCDAADGACGADVETEAMRASLLQKHVVSPHQAGTKAETDLQKRREEILAELETIDEELAGSKIECMGHFGSHIGDPACCGQGDLTNVNSEDHLCKEKKPTCDGFIEGVQWGRCTDKPLPLHPTPAPTSAKMRVKNVFNHFCMSPRKNGVLEISDCDGKDSVFKFTASGHLKNIKEDKCVGSKKDSFDLKLEKCMGNAEDQMFELKDRKFHLKALPAMCIDVEGLYQTHSGKKLQVAACSFAQKLSDQLWELVSK